MELDDPRAKRAFREYILGLQTDPRKIELTKKFLDVFLDPILAGEKNPTECSISLTDAAKWTRKTKEHLKRMIDPAYARKDRPKSQPTFRINVDFCYLPSTDSQNRERKELYMTVGTFKKVISRLDSELGESVLEYLWLTDGALRDWTGSTLREKLQRVEMSNEPGSDTKLVNRIYNKSGVELSPGMGYYTISFSFKGNNYFYQGITDNIATRLRRHALELPIGCDINLIEWAKDDDPEFMETCRRHYERKDRVPLPETLHGMRDIFFADEDHWKKATAHCQNMEHNGDEEWIAKGMSLDSESRMLASPDLYP